MLGQAVRISPHDPRALLELLAFRRDAAENLSRVWKGAVRCTSSELTGCGIAPADGVGIPCLLPKLRLLQLLELACPVFFRANYPRRSKPAVANLTLRAWRGSSDGGAARECW